MAKTSTFREFVRELKKDWRERSPSIRRIEKGFLPLMPKASTFYAGLAEPYQLHMYFYFQISSKSWEVGQFTINVVLSDRIGPPKQWHVFNAPGDVPSIAGVYRIGQLLGGGDKWWHLQEEPSWDDFGLDLPPLEFPAHWNPASFEDREGVIREAIADVNRDVEAALKPLSVAEKK